ncbi:MAG: site-specific integrase [Alphaproteobacteria bacterium]|nr:site-specific integrase [Alphaproteobacteria bacterium]
MSNNKEKYRLWKHANGTIYVVWTERNPTTKTGAQTKRVSTGTTDWRAAETYRAQLIAGLNNPASSAEPTIGYLLERYQAEHAPKTRSPETIGYHLKALKPFFGDLLPSHISNKLLEEYTKQRTGSNGTVLRQLSTLKAALRYAAGNRWISPVPTFRMPVRKPPPRGLWLTREQVATLISKAKSHHLRLFILLAVSTAARSGAILDLTWSQINFEECLIDFGRGFGNKRRAIVPMNNDVYKALKTAKELAQTENVIEFNGKRIQSVKGAFWNLCNDCRIEASPHVLRHTTATWLVMDGVPLREVARLLGNSEAMVEQVYGKHSPDYLRRAVKALTLPKFDTLKS